MCIRIFSLMIYKYRASFQMWCVFSLIFSLFAMTCFHTVSSQGILRITMTELLCHWQTFRGMSCIIHPFNLFQLKSLFHNAKCQDFKHEIWRLNSIKDIVRNVHKTCVLPVEVLVVYWSLHFWWPNFLPVSAYAHLLHIYQISLFEQSSYIGTNLWTVDCI